MCAQILQQQNEFCNQRNRFTKDYGLIKKEEGKEALESLPVDSPTLPPSGHKWKRNTFEKGRTFENPNSNYYISVPMLYITKSIWREEEKLLSHLTLTLNLCKHENAQRAPKLVKTTEFIF